MVPSGRSRLPYPHLHHQSGGRKECGAGLCARDPRQGKSARNSPARRACWGSRGVDDAIVLQALRDALGAEAGAAPARSEGRQITYTDLYEWGLSGRPGSAERKAKLLNALGLPPRLSKKELGETKTAPFSPEVGVYYYLKLKILKIFYIGDNFFFSNAWVSRRET